MMMNNPARILIIEDNPGDARLVKEALADAGGSVFRLVWKKDLLKGLEHLKKNPVDAILLDLTLPDSTGFATFERVHSQAPQTAIILLTGFQDEEQAAKAVRAGAQDYLFKGKADGERLARSIRYAIERKQAEQALRESEERYRAMMEQAADAVFMHDETGRIMDVNQKTCQILGYSREELLSKSMGDIDPEAVRVGKQKLWGRVVAGEHFTLESHLTRKDGSSFPVEVTMGSVRLHSGQAILSLVRDISERRRAEQALRESQQMLRLVLDTVPVRVFWKDLNSNHLGCNRAFALDAGFKTTEEVIGKNDGQMVWKQQAEIYRADDRAVIESGRPKINYEEPQTAPDGRLTWVRASKIPLLDEEGKVKGVLGTYEDITEFKQVLSQQQTFYNALNASLNELYIFDAETLHFEFVSAGALRNLGYTLDELRGMTPLDLKPEFTRKSFQDLIAPLRLHESPVIDFKTFHRRANGSSYPVEVHLQLFDQTEHPVFLAVILDITERQQAEEALRASEDKFKYIFDYSVVGKSITLPNGEFQPNKAFCEMLGYSKEELQSKSWQDITHPDDIESSQRELDSLLSGKKEAARFIKRYLKKDGSVLWADASTSPRWDGQHKLLYLMTSIVDITEQKQAEEALIESESRFRTLIKEAPIAILISRDGIIEYVNQKDAQIFGLQNGEDVVGRPIIEFLAPQSREQSLEHTRRRSLGLPVSTEFEYVGLRPDGSQFPIHVAVTDVHLRNGDANISFITDITERKRAEEALIESEQRFRSVFENSTVGIYRTTPAGQILMANPALVSMLGYHSFEELRRRDLEADAFEPTYPRSRFRELIEKDGEVRNLESAWKRQDGKVLYIRESAKAFPNPDGTIKYYEGSVEDITDRKHIEDALRTSEERYRGLFEDSPIALWEEDFSAVKLSIENLRKQGVTDFRVHFKSHPEQVTQCIEQIKVVDVNRAALKQLGAQSKAEIPANLSIMIPGEAHEDFQEELINIADVKSAFEWQGINYTLAGERRVINMRWSVAPGHEDTLDKVLVSMIDVTERKQAEEQIQILSKFPAEDPYPVLRIAPDGILLYANPSSEPLLAMWNIQTGLAMPEEWRAWIAEVFSSSQNKEVEIQCGEQVFSCILAPIVDAGYVNLYGRDITQRKQAEEALGRRTRELGVRNEELDRLYRATGSLLSSTPFEAQALARTIVELALQEFGHANCSVFLIRKGSKELNRLAVAGPYADQVSKIVLTLEGKGQVSRAIQRGQVINTPDVRTSSDYVPSWEMARSELTIPLKIEDQVIGAIDVQSAEPNAFKTDDERRMTIFAERAALALDRGRLNEELESRLQQLTSLRTIDVAISSSMDIHLTLGILLEQVIQTLGVQAADVLIFNPVTQSFRYSTGRGFRTQALQHTDLRLGDGYAGQAARDRQILLIRDLPKNTGGLQRSADFRGEGFVSYVGAPLIAKGQVKGVLEIFQRSPFDLSSEQRAFLETLAGQAAIAIDSGQLFENLQSSNSELMMAYDETIEGWSRAMDLRDKETEGHTQRVTELTLRLAGSMGFRGEELVHIRRGALLHDIGKMGVPDDILRKPGALTDEEWGIMRKHPQFAYDMLAPIIYLRPAIDIPYCHHEKWDGTGYPRALKGEQIPLAARIFALVDVWDALCSDRPYRKAWPEDKVRSHIQEQAGKHFDPHIVEVFLKEVSHDG